MMSYHHLDYEIKMGIILIEKGRREREKEGERHREFEKGEEQS